MHSLSIRRLPMLITPFHLESNRVFCSIAPSLNLPKQTHRLHLGKIAIMWTNEQTIFSDKTLKWLSSLHFSGDKNTAYLYLLHNLANGLTDIRWESQGSCAKRFIHIRWALFDKTVADDWKLTFSINHFKKKCWQTIVAYTITCV